MRRSFLVAEAVARGVGEQRRERVVLVDRSADEALLDRRAGEQIGRGTVRLLRALDAPAQRQAERLLVGTLELGVAGGRLAPGADSWAPAPTTSACASDCTSRWRALMPASTTMGVSLHAAPTCAHSSGGAVDGSMSRSSSTSSNSPGCERGRNDGPIAWRDDRLATASACATCFRVAGWRDTIAARPTDRMPLLDAGPATGLF